MAALAVGPFLTAGIVLILGRAARRAEAAKAAA
jgi:hypothetical protein